MKTFEYLCVHPGQWQLWMCLNVCGLDGWELVTVQSDGVLIMKRERTHETERPEHNVSATKEKLIQME